MYSSLPTILEEIFSHTQEKTKTSGLSIRSAGLSYLYLFSFVIDRRSYTSIGSAVLLFLLNRLMQEF